MKQLKVVLVMAVVVLLVAIIGFLIFKNPGSQTMSMKERIKQYEMIAKEQRLVTEIIQLRYDAAMLQSKMQPAPKAQPSLTQLIPKEQTKALPNPSK